MSAFNFRESNLCQLIVLMLSLFITVVGGVYIDTNPAWWCIIQHLQTDRRQTKKERICSRLRWQSTFIPGYFLSWDDRQMFVTWLVDAACGINSYSAGSTLAWRLRSSLIIADFTSKKQRWSTWFMHRIKPEDLYIHSCGKGRGRRPRPFPQLRM